MKAMVIGLGPDYNYPGTSEEWMMNNTRFASNHGASLISRTLAKQFEADYIDDFSDIQSLKEKYNLCVIAFATHITSCRDVSLYADVIEKLDMKTVAFSLGVQDYSTSPSDVFSLHSSMKRLLALVSERSKYLGVRGHYTASILYKHGFKNVMPIGCPTLYWGLRPDLHIEKSDGYRKPLISYHRTLTGINKEIISNIPLLGQDFLDEVVFTNNLDADARLKNYELSAYYNQDNAELALHMIKDNGVFHYTFQEWFDFIGNHDFVLGARLHGCIAALIQGIPAVLLTRDLRMLEIAELLGIPAVPYEQLRGKTVEGIFNEADYSQFNRTYRLRYENYLSLLDENGLADYHCLMRPEAHKEFMYTWRDFQKSISILHDDIQQIKSYDKALRTASVIYRLLNKTPVIKKILRRYI